MCREIVLLPDMGGRHGGVEKLYSFLIWGLKLMCREIVLLPDMRAVVAVT